MTWGGIGPAPVRERCGGARTRGGTAAAGRQVRKRGGGEHSGRDGDSRPWMRERREVAGTRGGTGAVCREGAGDS